MSYTECGRCGSVFATHMAESWVHIQYCHGCTALRLPCALVCAPLESIRSWFRLLFENKRMNIASIDYLNGYLEYMNSVAKAFGDEDDEDRAQSVIDEFDSASKNIEEECNIQWLDVEHLPF